MKKIRKIILLTLLLIFLLGVVNATCVTSNNAKDNNNATVRDTTSTASQDNAKIIKDNTKIKTNINDKYVQKKNTTKNINLKPNSNNNVKTAGLDSMTIIIKEGQNYNQIINSVRFMDATKEIIIELPENQKFDITSQFICGNKRNTKIFTINGNGSVFNGQNTNSFITVQDGFTLNLNNVTITNTTGESGCSINNSGTANINNTTIIKNIGNKNGAIYNNGGNLSIAHSTLINNSVYENGGAIYNMGTYKISDTIFYNNTPANFIINENNHIKLANNDNFIDITNFEITVDDEILRGVGLEELEQYIIPPEALNIKLLLNGTNTTDNIFIIKETPEKINIANVTLTNENPICGDTTDIIATVIVDDKPINEGTVIFRLNGKTIRNNNHEVIYVDITDGKAILENVPITGTWVEMETIVQAVFSGNDELEPIWTEKIIVTASKPKAKLEITAPSTAQLGDTITLSTSVTNENIPINTGRVVFKLNGKTLKDAEGKALYVNVVNGITTTKYTIPSKIKSKTYNLTAVFTDTAYERCEKETQITVI